MVLVLCLLSFDHMTNCIPEDSLIEERFLFLSSGTKPYDSQTFLIQPSVPLLSVQFPCIDNGNN